jgi:hypothetical protein
VAPTGTPTPTGTAIGSPAPTPTPTSSPARGVLPGPVSAVPTGTPTATPTSTGTAVRTVSSPNSTAAGNGGTAPANAGAPSVTVAGAVATPTTAPSSKQTSIQLECGQTGGTEDGAPAGYVNDPRGPQGQPHPDYGSGLVTERDRDVFRENLPAGTQMAAVNDAIARGCSAQWIRTHLGSP